VAEVDEATVTRAALVDALRRSGEESVAAFRAIDPADWERGGYENGWNGRQILAHVASIEWTYPRLFDLARSGGGAPDSAPAPGGGATTAPASGGISGYNDRQVEKRAGVGVEDLIAEFERNRAATIAALEAADEDLLSVQIRTAGGIEGTLAQALLYVAVIHVRDHVDAIAG
jgi:hypothetical protein